MAITAATMWAWDRVATARGLTTFPSPLTPLLGNAAFDPGLDAFSFRAWQEVGCKHAGDLFDLDGAISFDRLRHDRGFPDS